MITIEKLNDVYNRVYCEPSIAQELADRFTFDVPGARFSPQFKRRMWDGKIRLFSSATRLMYRGLIEQTIEFAKERGYEIKYDTPEDFSDWPWSLKESDEFAKKLKTLTLTPKDYQLNAFTFAVRKQRALLVSPTASGKSKTVPKKWVNPLNPTGGRSQKQNTLSVKTYGSITNKLYPLGYNRR